jgi:WD40 repeat protein
LRHPGLVRAVAWRPDGRLLAAACGDFNIHVWDVDRQRSVAVLEGHEAEPTEVAFHPDGHLLVSTGWDGTARLWDPLSKKLLATGPGGCAEGFPHYQFSADGRRLAFAWDGASRLGLWEVAPARECRVFTAHGATGKGVWDVDLSADGRLLASAHDDGVRLWDLSSQREVLHLPDVGIAQTARFLPQDQGLLVYGRAGLRLWPVGPPGGPVLLGPPLPLLDVPFQLPAAQYASAGRDGRRLAAADRVNGQVIVLDRPQGDRCCLPDHAGVSRVTLSPDGRWVASGTWKPVPSVVRVADVAKRNVARVWGAEAALGAFSPDGRWLLMCGEECRFWAVGSWEPGRLIPADPALGRTTAAAFRPDGRLLALAHASRVVRLVDPDSGQELAALTAPFALQANCLTFSPDGGRLAVACANHRVLVWDLREVFRQLAEMGLSEGLPAVPEGG